MRLVRPGAALTNALDTLQRTKRSLFALGHKPLKFSLALRRTPASLLEREFSDHVARLSEIRDVVERLLMRT